MSIHPGPFDPARVAVVGGGLAGLAAARALMQAGCVVQVIDKGRGPSGRAATRRAGPWRFDHGAQYFTVRSQRFAREVRSWWGAGVIAPWRGRVVALGERGQREVGAGTTRFVGTPGMSAIARALAAGLEVRSARRVESVRRVEDQWELDLEDGARLGGFDQLVVTTPAPQAVPLLSESPTFRALAAGTTMTPCVALMLGLERPFATGFDGAFVDDQRLSWIARDSSKPGRLDGEAWVLHATPEWSRARFEASDEALADELERALAELVGVALPPVLHRAVHRWRYAQADPALEERALYDPALGLGVAGDWLNASRVEGAFLSGVTVADRLLARGLGLGLGTRAQSPSSSTSAKP